MIKHVVLLLPLNMSDFGLTLILGCIGGGCAIRARKTSCRVEKNQLKSNLTDTLKMGNCQVKSEWLHSNG
jgi:hypothetical protein